jgi:hypothetical protein
MATQRSISTWLHLAPQRHHVQVAKPLLAPACNPDVRHTKALSALDCEIERQRSIRYSENKLGMEEVVLVVGTRNTSTAGEKASGRRGRRGSQEQQERHQQVQGTNATQLLHSLDSSNPPAQQRRHLEAVLGRLVSTTTSPLTS